MRTSVRIAESRLHFPDTRRIRSAALARLVPLSDAITELVHDGDSVALEGFSHLVPFEAGHEIIRQARRHLTLVRMVPDIIGDQLIGTGCLDRLVFAWAGNPGVGSLHRFRDAIEHAWPRALEIDENSHAGMANRYLAGATGMPFAVLRAYAGTDLAPDHAAVRPVACPFTGEEVAAVPALRPDVAIIHAQRADRDGNVQLWGITGVQKEAVLSAQRSLVTVETVVDRLDAVAGSIVLPSWAVTCVALAPGGTYPSYAQGFTARDDGFYAGWDAIARDRERFTDWIDGHVMNAASAAAGPAGTGTV